MASELSRFIEDELRKQGIADDEEQRLLSNLRVKPLSVQAPGSSGGGGGAGWSTKQKAFVGVGLALLLAALLALVWGYRGHPALTTSNFRGALVDPEAGVVPEASGSMMEEAEAVEVAAERAAAERAQEAARQQQEKKAAAAAAAAGGKKGEAAGEPKQQEPEAPAGEQKGNATEPATPAAGDKGKKAEPAAGNKKQPEQGGRRRLLRD